jgi:hypothetical protein
MRNTLHVGAEEALAYTVQPDGYHVEIYLYRDPNQMKRLNGRDGLGTRVTWMGNAVVIFLGVSEYPIGEFLTDLRHCDCLKDWPAPPSSD